MRLSMLTRRKRGITKTLWSKGPGSLRELREAFLEDRRLARMAVLTMANLLEAREGRPPNPQGSRGRAALCQATQYRRPE